MTLKEKIAEIKPDKISVHFYAGVYGCPAEYYVLHGSLEKDEIEKLSEDVRKFSVRRPTDYGRSVLSGRLLSLVKMLVKYDVS